MRSRVQAVRPVRCGIGKVCAAGAEQEGCRAGAYCSLFMQERDFANLGYATVYALGSGIGWFIAIVSIAAIREKLAYSNFPKPLKGLGISFIITGLMGIAFMSFMGIQL